MTQTPEEWTIAAMAERKPGIKIAPLRPASLKPYQEAFIREMLVSTSTTDQVTVMATRIGIDPYATLKAHEIMATLSVDKADPEACRRRVIGPDGLWMWEVGGAA